MITACLKFLGTSEYVTVIRNNKAKTIRDMKIFFVCLHVTMNDVFPRDTINPSDIL